MREYTFDTVTIGGRIAYYNIAWYRPRPLIARSKRVESARRVVALRKCGRFPRSPVACAWASM